MTFHAWVLCAILSGILWLIGGPMLALAWLLINATS
jgi:hypothetical protein